MISAKVFKQIHELTVIMVSLSMANDQNFPSTAGKANGKYEITVNNADKLSAALKNVSYQDIYMELDKAKCYNFKMLDGALVTLRYRFEASKISEHSLTYFPSPSLEQFQNDPEVYNDDVIYADIIARNIVPFPVRFDYSNDPKKFIEVHHPYSHLTLGQYKNCRIPVSAPLMPLMFGQFILRNFYNTAYRKYSDSVPNSSLNFEKTITANEQKLPHLACSS